MAGPVLYLHVTADGAMFSVRADGTQAWLSLQSLEALAEDLFTQGGSILYSADRDPALTPVAAATLRRVVGTGLPCRELPKPHPAIVEGLPQGTTPLMLFAHRGELELMADMLDRGSPPDERDETGITALMFAASAGNLEVAHLLLAKGADPNAADERGVTPLMFAATRGDAELVRVLLDGGADPRAEALEGLTALALAEDGGHTKVVSMLTRAGGFSSG